MSRRTGPVLCLVLGVLTVAGLRGPAAAQTEPPVDVAAEERPGNHFIPIPVVFYTPETRLALGLSGAYLYRGADATADSRPSTLGAFGIYTVRNQVILSVGGDHYFDRDRQQLNGGISYRKFPNDFYGLGNDTDADFSEGYTDEGAGLMLDYLREVWPGVRLGAGLNIASSSITGADAGELLASGQIPGSQGGQVLGLGLLAHYDTRENITYPHRGSFWQLAWRVYEDVLGADYALTATTLDLRQYLPLGPGRVLALRALGTATGGDVPFQLMPELGGDLLMRGYYQGRYRERQRVAGQAELRVGTWRRLGMVAFGGIGQVAHDLDQLGLGRFHYNYGAGLRILLIEEERANLRLDFGFGEDQSGFYLGFGEVF